MIRHRPITPTVTIVSWILVLAMAAVATVHANQFPQTIPAECAGNPAC